MAMESYPLYWPDGWKRTPPSYRIQNNQFRQALGKYRDDLYNELDRLHAARQIVSTNIQTRGDGKLYATWKEPDDPGVAIYFRWNDKSMTMACDKYATVAQNIRAITLTIQAIRGIDRWGASDMMERAFRGFAALPEAPWKQVLGFHNGDEVSKEIIEKKFVELAKIYHPDKEGGDEEKFREAVRAREAALASLGLLR